MTGCDPDPCGRLNSIHLLLVCTQILLPAVEPGLDLPVYYFMFKTDFSSGALCNHNMIVSFAFPVSPVALCHFEAHNADNTLTMYSVFHVLTF